MKKQMEISKWEKNGLTNQVSAVLLGEEWISIYLQRKGQIGNSQTVYSSWYFRLPAALLDVILSPWLNSWRYSITSTTWCLLVVREGTCPDAVW